MKQCSKCKIWKVEGHFSKCKNRKKETVLRSWCKECARSNQRKWYNEGGKNMPCFQSKEAKLKAGLKGIEYYWLNYEYYAEYRKSENRESSLLKYTKSVKFRDVQKRYKHSVKGKLSRKLCKQKSRENPQYRLNSSISRSINRGLTGQKNNRHWEDLVGYNLDELKEHLEKRFCIGMDWNNYGFWHIDHIIPQSFFKFDNSDDVEFKMCWRLENLQPLWAKENMLKSNSLSRVFTK